MEVPTSEQPKAPAEWRIDARFMHIGPRTALARRKRSAASVQEETVLERMKMQSGSLGVVVANDHPFARKKSVSLSDLAGERFVVVPHSIVTQ